MTKAEVNKMKNRLDAKCATCFGVPTKYRDAFRDGTLAAKTVLEACVGETKDMVMAELHRLLNKNPYLSGNKTEAYRKALRSAMSMVHSL